MSAISQEHVSKRAPVLVLAVGLQRDLLPKDESSRGLPSLFAKGLAFVMAAVVQDFDGVTVENSDNFALKLREGEQYTKGTTPTSLARHHS